MSAAPVINPILKLKLKVIAGPHLNEIFTVHKSVTKIGRGEENDIKLSSDNRISRYHAEIYIQNDQFKFKNISQKNFILVDGQVLKQGDLISGSKIQMGETTFEVFNDAPSVVQGELTVKVDPIVKPLILQKSPQALVTPAAAAPKAVAQKKNAPLASPKKSTVKPQQSFKPASSSSDNGRIYLYGGLAILLAGLYYVFTLDNKKEVQTFRSSQQVEYDLLQSSDEKKRLQERLEVMQSVGAQRSQENLIKGFREFQQGNYARARDNFQVVLNLDPDNAIAKRYFHLSKIKFDEMLQFHMLQGLRYRDKKNYRLCRSSFQSALIMIQNNQQHPKYREIKNFFDECDLALEGRY